MAEYGLLVGTVESFITALYSFPLIILGMWLSTKSWCFYFLVAIGFAWVAFVISGMVYEIWLNPEVSTTIKVMSWSILPIFFTVANTGAILTIRNARVGEARNE